MSNTINLGEVVENEVNTIKRWDSLKLMDFNQYQLKYETHTSEIQKTNYLILERYSILQLNETNRLKTLVNFLNNCYLDNLNDSYEIEENLSNQYYRELILFNNNAQNFNNGSDKLKLGRGLLRVILKNVNLNDIVYPDHSTFVNGSISYDLFKDINSIKILEVFELLGINSLPLILPYNTISDFVYLYQLNILDEETCWSPYIEYNFIESLLKNGFITISLKFNISEYLNSDSMVEDGSNDDLNNDFKNKEVVILIAKMHKIRCVMDPKEIKIKKKVVKLSHKYKITINKCFHKVISGIVNKHGQNWMYPIVQLEFLKLHYFHNNNNNNNYNLLNKENELKNGNLLNNEREKDDGRLVSVEVWDELDNLVSGEVGFVNGSIYTSITGFHTVNNSGNVQLVSLAALLYFNGFKLWDLGMYIPYKVEMGAECILRNHFISQLNCLRDEKSELEVPKKYADKSCYELIADFMSEINLDQV